MNYDAWKLKSPYDYEPENVYGHCENCNEYTILIECDNLEVCKDCYNILSQLHNNIVKIKRILHDECKIYLINYKKIYDLDIESSIDILENLLEDYPKFRKIINFNCPTCESECIHDNGILICAKCGDCNGKY